MTLVKKLLVLFLLVFASLPSFVFAQTLPNPITENERLANYGLGTFPDVAFFKDYWWVAASQGDFVNVYRGTDATNLQIFKAIRTSQPTLSFPRIYVHNDTVWVAFRDDAGNSNQAWLKVWRLDTDTVESIAGGRTTPTDYQPFGNSPIAMGWDSIAWQKSYDDGTGKAKTVVVIRPLIGPLGSEVPIGDGRPTGIARVKSPSKIILEDDNRNLLPWVLQPAFAWPLIAGQGASGGLTVRFNNDPRTERRLITQTGPNNPRAATNGKGGYMVVFWSARSPNPAYEGLNAFSFTSRVLEGPIPAEFEYVQKESNAFRQNPLPPPPSTARSLGELIQYIYLYGLYVVGLAVFSMMIWAGILWFTSAGNASKISDAKSKIYNSIIGAILLLSAFLILNTINPDLVRGSFIIPTITSSQPVNTQRCNVVEGLPYYRSSDVRAAANDFINRNKTVGDSLTTNSAAIDTFLNGTVQVLNSRGFRAGRVQGCNNTLSLDSVIAGLPADTAGELIKLFVNLTSPTTIRDALNVNYEYHTDWARIR